MGFLSDLFGGGLPTQKLDPHTRKEVDNLVAELVKIGQVDDYLSERPGAGFDGQCHHIRSRQIGRRLHDLGGLELMQAVHRVLRRKMGKQGKTLVSHLDYCWNEIGQWHA